MESSAVGSYSTGWHDIYMEYYSATSGTGNNGGWVSSVVQQGMAVVLAWDGMTGRGVA